MRKAMSTFRFLVSASVRRLALPACLSLLVLSVASAEVRTKGALSKPKFDPAAQKVELFKGIEEGMLEVKVVPKDAMGGTVFLQNNGDQPLTVEVPQAIVGVQVLKQFGGDMGDFGGGAAGDFGGTDSGAGGGAQAFGGGMGGMGGGMMGGGGYGGGGMGGMGGGFFSIPPEKVVKVPYQSVCLDHGKPEPRPTMTYQLVPVEKYTDNVALQELLARVGTGRIDPQAAQAAAWVLDDGMSWQELAAKKIKRAGGVPDTPYFSPLQLRRAQEAVTYFVARARESQKDKPEEPADETTPARARGIRAALRGLR
jgi:hypothetical protein